MPPSVFGTMTTNFLNKGIEIMATVTEFLATEHRSGDECFASAEDAAQDGDLSLCRVRFQQFRTVMEQHFQKEEDTLFPPFEQASGSPMGPTQVMRLEHQQMRESFAALDSALAAGDLEEYLGQAETLLILMQQHNIKEEQILYPMCDQILETSVRSIIQAMQDVPVRQLV